MGNTSFPARHYCFPKQNFWFPKREQGDLWQALLIMKHFTSGWRHSCIVTARLGHWQHDRLTAEKSLQTINQPERYFTKKHWTWLNTSTGTVWLMFILAPKQTLIQQKLTFWFIISINHWVISQQYFAMKCFKHEWHLCPSLKSNENRSIHKICEAHLQSAYLLF